MMNILKKGGSFFLGTFLLLLLCLFVQEGQAKDKSSMKVEHLKCKQTSLKTKRDAEVTCTSDVLMNSPWRSRCKKTGSSLFHDVNTCFTETVKEYNDDDGKVGKTISKISGCSCTQGFQSGKGEEVGKCITHKEKEYPIDKKPKFDVTYCNCVEKYCNKGGVKTTTPILLVSALVFIISSSYWSHTHTHY